MSGSEVVLVTTPEPTSITDSYSLLKAINRNKDYDKSNLRIRVAVNKVSSQNEGKALFSKLNVVDSEIFRPVYRISWSNTNG